MKELVLVGLFLLSAYAKADQGKSQKEILLEKNKTLIGEVQKLKDQMEEDKIKDACSNVAQIFSKYEAYVLDAGMHMESKDRRRYKTIIDDEGQYQSVISMEGSKRRHRKVVKAAVEEMAYFSELKLLCSAGKDQEYVRADEVSDNLKEVLSSLRKQGRKIKRDDVDESNSFSATFKTGNAFRSKGVFKN
jgi:hypothetical protein